MKANDRQVGGNHYRVRGDVMQHWDYCWQKGFDQFQYQITKYVERWRNKNGVQDLEKAMHFLEKYIELVKADDEQAERLLRSMDSTQDLKVIEEAWHKKYTTPGDESIAAHTDGQDKKPSPKTESCRWCGKIFGDKFSVHAIGCPGIGKEGNEDGGPAPPAPPVAPPTRKLSP